MRIHRGISLVRTLVALAVLVVIAVIAIPLWQGHVIKEHLGEALKAGDAAKLVVMEAATVRGGLANIRQQDLLYGPSSTGSPYAATVQVAESGRITIVTKDTGASPAPTFLLTPIEAASPKGGQSLSWSCDIVAGDAQRKPDSCTRPDNLPAATVVPVPTSSTQPPPAASR